MQNVHPDFLKELQQLLPPQEVEQFLDACFRPLKKTITLNISKIDIATFIETTKLWGRSLTPITLVDDTTTFYIDREIREQALGRTFLHQAGFFYVQEAAASLPATQVNVSSGNIILDMAAAPGGKTLQLAQKLLALDHPGVIVANDVNKERIKVLAHNLNKGGCYNTAITSFNGFMFGSHLPNFFDHVLLDAPCSGEGTGYKSDVAMQYRNQAEINKIAGTQFQLLISAIKTTKPGGTIIYSTCTINPYENETIVSKALDFFAGTVELIQTSFHNVSSGHALQNETLSGFDPKKVARCRPHLHHTGGFFVAKLRKIEPTKDAGNHDHKLLPRNQFKIDMSKGLQNKVALRLKEEFGIKTDPQHHLFIASKDKLYLTSPAVKEIAGQLNFEKMGIPVAKIDKDIYRPTHHLGNILGHLATKQTITLTTEQAQAYSEGKNIPLQDLSPHATKGTTPYRILTRGTYGLSIGKIVGEEVKNKFM